MTYRIYKTCGIYETDYATVPSLNDAKDFFFSNSNWTVIDFDVEPDGSGADFAVQIGASIETFIVDTI